MARGSTKVRKSRYSFHSGSKKSMVLNPGDHGNEVRALQAYLAANGYLAGQPHPGHMCSCTCEALRFFQKCYGLKDTGIGDRDTLQLIERPRCGVPDIGPDRTRNFGPAPFVLRGCKYSNTNLSYAFLNGTGDLPAQLEQDIIREAFGAWSSVTPLRFREVAPDESPDFPIAWEQGAHGDGAPFDNGGSLQGNTLAHAFYPPPCGGQFSGSMHFDEFENWVDEASQGAIRLLNVAIHEIGHLLGLNHSNNRDAIMFAFYSDDVDSLRQDDINGIQELYGAPTTGTLPIRGSLNHSDDSNTHRIQVRPSQLTVTLRGPNNADFDLYVRMGLQPTRQLFDARGFSGTPNEKVTLNVSGGEAFIMVDSWRGSGSYELEVEMV